MKTSVALIAGFSKVNGQQCFGTYEVYSNRKIVACCLVSAIGYFVGQKESCEITDVCIDVFGCGAAYLNDYHRMDWRDVVGILQAEGL